MDPYADLGVPRNADGKTIKRAYRKRVMKEHPDRGGSEEGFKRLQLAYDVLSDPARKDKYDRTGDSGIDQAAQQAFAELASMFVLLAQQCDPDHQDLKALLVQNVRQQILAHDQAITNQKATIAKMERAAKRVRKKSGGENLVEGFFRAHVLQCQNAIARAEREIERGRMILKLADDYEWIMDKAPIGAHGQFVPLSQFGWQGR